ncbi:MAG: glutaredoxin domain-containing protein [Pseudonocardiaceae bacterium]
MTETVIEFYWRPGCPYCSALRGPLRRTGLPVRGINIWEDPQAAAWVRSVAGGNETVPTVFVGTHAVVNPSMGQVLAAVREHAPDLAAGAEPAVPRWQPTLAALVVALLWVLLAVRMPTTTYHLAPLLVASVPAVAGRWLTRAPVQSRLALAWPVIGLVVALAATAVLAWRACSPARTSLAAMPRSWRPCCWPCWAPPWAGGWLGEATGARSAGEGPQRVFDGAVEDRVGVDHLPHPFQSAPRRARPRGASRRPPDAPQRRAAQSVSRVTPPLPVVPASGSLPGWTTT